MQNVYFFSWAVFESFKRKRYLRLVHNYRLLVCSCFRSRAQSGVMYVVCMFCLFFFFLIFAHHNRFAEIMSFSFCGTDRQQVLPWIKCGGHITGLCSFNLDFLDPSILRNKPKQMSLALP